MSIPGDPNWDYARSQTNAIAALETTEEADIDFLAGQLGLGRGDTSERNIIRSFRKQIILATLPPSPSASVPGEGNGYYGCSMPPGACHCPQIDRHKCHSAHWIATESLVAPQPGAQDAVGMQERIAKVSEVLARFHRNACYPDAMSHELYQAATEIAALQSARGSEGS